MLCMRVSSLPVPDIPSEKHPCVECKEDVWISPASVTLLSASSDEPLCVECVIRMKKSLKLDLRCPSKDQLEEIKTSRQSRNDARKNS